MFPLPDEFKLMPFNHTELTDAHGRWTCTHFPALGGHLQVRAVRPDGSFANFTTWKPEYQDSARRELLPMESFLATNATLVLKPGIEVRGLVVDAKGQPVAGAQLAEGYGMGNIDILSRITTGPDGRFKLANRARREMILTAQADGYAITSIVVPVQPGLDEVRITLAPQRPLRGRVVNGEGEPLAAADVRIEPYTTKAQILDWSTKTDAHGRFEWSAAPDKPVALMVHATNYPPRKAILTSGPTEHLIRLRKENKDVIRITGKVVDAESKQPIESFTVKNTQEFSNLRLSAEGSKGEFTLEVRQSDFSQGYYPGFKLRITAEGYESSVSEPMEFLEGDRTLAVELKKGAGGLAGVVRLPDGAPAMEAKVFGIPKDRVLYSHQPGEFRSHDGAVTVASDAEGRFKLPASPDETASIVVTHENGFAAMTVEDFRVSSEIKLQAWGSIEGAIRLGSKPGSKERVHLYNGANWHPTQMYQFYYQVQADEDGAFFFDKIPPGQGQLYRVPGGQRPGPTIFSHQQAVSVKPGETSKVIYGGTGRPVIGRIEPSEWISTIDWQWDNHALKAKSKQTAANADAEQPYWEDYATQESFEKAQKAYFASRGRGGASDQFAQQYKLTFESDGSFRVDDVPAGAYALAIRVTEPSKDPNTRFMWQGDQAKEIGSLVREIVVPEMPGGRSDEPFDLGTLEMKVTAPPGSLRSVADIEVKTVDGLPLKLADYRGKVVLLTFWGAWSDACQRDLPALKAVYEAFEKNPRFAMIGLSLDENPEVPKQFAKARELRWTQGYLDDEAKIKVTDAFDVSEVPSILLITPEGKIALRDLRAQGVEKSVERALQRKY
jgi:peroxiredoxin